MSAQVQAATGLGSAGNTQSVQGNLGSLTDPTGVRASINGFELPELAWQQAFAKGRFVAVVGMVSQGNYFDLNRYANNGGGGEFLNSALINSMVLPLPSHTPGVNLQWQPHTDWYVLFGGSAGNAAPTAAPWVDFTWDYWTALWEIGYAPDDVFGLGPGVYRVQPFVARAGGSTQGGVGFNAQQQLGEHSPFGWFGRFGFGGSEVTAGASAQIGTGFAMEGPLAKVGLLPSRRHDSAGVGFVWSQPSDSAAPVVHENEYVLETSYALHITPTAMLQPDLQLVWNPSFSPYAGPTVVFQLQLDLIW